MNERDLRAAQLEFASQMLSALQARDDLRTHHPVLIASIPALQYLLMKLDNIDALIKLVGSGWMTDAA